MLTHLRTQKLIELVIILFLFHHTFWHLIYFERNSGLVFLSFFLLGIFFLYSVIRHWRGLRNLGIRFDNLMPSLKATLIPLALVAGYGILALLVKQRPGRLPGGIEFITFFLWGTFQQLIIQGYFLSRYEDVFGKKWVAIILAASTFSLFHLANLDLMVLTFLGGLYLSNSFYRWRNVFASGFLHGMISLILVVTLKPAHVISTNYRVGPDPLGPMRGLIQVHAGHDMEMVQYLPSRIPNSFYEHFDGKVRRIGDPFSLEKILQRGDTTFAVLTEEDYQDFLSTKQTNSFFLWRRSLMWRRNFSHDKFETIRCIFTLDLARLNQLYRLPVVLISNRPPPASTGQK